MKAPRRGVELASTRLRLSTRKALKSRNKVGYDVPVDGPFLPEDRLYAKLSEADSDSAHSRYNALIRRLVSFERAAECVNA